MTKSEEELRKSLGIKSQKEIDYSVCASAVQIIADMSFRTPKKIIELLTNWAWNKEEAEEILRFIKK